MLLPAISAALLLAGLSTAQTPEGFTPEVKDNLDVIFGTKAVTTPGTSLAKAGLLTSGHAMPTRF